ncbi:MAG: polyamine ABC transporter ATP-binding protein [Actinobacteria bacterium]|uniref:Unannotated protein n=1 Tax=freshwater metagenome TaxID=449393 RepID=A0A6J7VT66_9ZZZZ|nr:polyamine ABC transporter ATP-binding protein [Actinomycetota bacterium]
MTEKKNLIEIRNLTHCYGDVTAIDDINLDIQENEFFALLGPSGCGKTTLLRVLAGFETPDAGTVMLGNMDLISIPPNKRPINLMFQSYALFPHMNVGQNVAYGLEREKLGKNEIKTRVAEVLETVGLSDKSKSRPLQLSGGQRQRVALARAIIKRPKLLLLDEPLSALDRKVRAEMQIELKRLQHEVGITFVVVTHDQEEAMSMADRIAVIAKGKVEQVDFPVDLYERPKNRYVGGFIGDSNFFDGIATSDGIINEKLGLMPGNHYGRNVTGPAHLLIRPEDLRVAQNGEHSISAKVQDVAFFGGASTIILTIDNHPTTVLFSQPGSTSIQRGSQLQLTWDTQKAIVLPSDSPSESNI